MVRIFFNLFILAALVNGSNSLNVTDTPSEDAYNQIDPMIDQLRNSNFQSIEDLEVLMYFRMYLSKWNSKFREDYGQTLGAHGLLDVFASWMTHFELQSSRDLSKPLLGKMLAVLYEGTKYNGFSGYVRKVEIMPKILRLSWNRNLFNDSFFTEDLLIVTFDTCWNLYFMTVFRPYVVGILSSAYGDNLQLLDTYNRSAYGDFFQLYRGKMLALRDLSETEATQRYSFNRSTLLRMREKFLKRVEYPLDQPVYYQLHTNFIFDKMELAYHDILLFFNNLFMSTTNRQQLCDNMTYHHYMMAINIFINQSGLSNRKEFERMCVRAIRGLTMLQITCDTEKYYSNEDKANLLKLESYPFPTIQTESSSLMTFVNTSQRVCYNGTVSYLVDFGGVKPICNAFIDIRNSTNEWLIIAAACVTGSFVFSIIITFIIKEIRMSIIRNLGKKLSHSSDQIRLHSDSSESVNTNIQYYNNFCTTHPRLKYVVDLFFHDSYYIDVTQDRVIPRIDYERLPYVSTLGTGNFGRVDKKLLLNPSHPNSSVLVAVKSAEAACQEVLKAEKLIMARMPLHVNVLKLLAITFDPEGLEQLILEHCEHESLHKVILKSVLRDESFSTDIQQLEENYGIAKFHLYYIAYQILDGMTFLSKHSLVHRDLACRNILLSTGFLVKISDFGLTKEAIREYCAISDNPVPPEIAPEARLKRVFTSKSDVYSMGILLWLLFELSMSNCKTLLKLASSNPIAIESPKYACDKVFELIQACLKSNPKSRPTFESCKNQFISTMNLISPTIIELVRETVIKYGNIRFEIENLNFKDGIHNET